MHSTPLAGGVLFVIILLSGEEGSAGGPADLPR